MALLGLNAIFAYLGTDLMKTLLSFLVSRKFLKSLAIVLLAYFVLVYGSLAFLKVYTDHGDSVTVRDFRGYKMEELDGVFQEAMLSYKVIDTVFREGAKRGTVVEQNPIAGSQVKENRTIYLTVNAPGVQMVEMPDLIDKDKAYAIAKLDIIGLRVKELKYRPDAVCTDCILNQKYRGKDVAPGSMLPRGAQILLVLGQGKSDELKFLPPLLGLTINEAKMRLNEQSLNLGSFICPDCETEEDSLAARIYRQNPEYYEDAQINLGSFVDVWGTIDSTKAPAPLPPSDPDQEQLAPIN